MTRSCWFINDDLQPVCVQSVNWYSFIVLTSGWSSDCRGVSGFRRGLSVLWRLAEGLLTVLLRWSWWRRQISVRSAAGHTISHGKNRRVKEEMSSDSLSCDIEIFAYILKIDLYWNRIWINYRFNQVHWSILSGGAHWWSAAVMLIGVIHQCLINTLLMLVRWAAGGSNTRFRRRKV